MSFDATDALQCSNFNANHVMLIPEEIKVMTCSPNKIYEIVLSICIYTAFKSELTQNYLHFIFESLSPFTLNCETPWINSVGKKKKETKLTYKISFCILIFLYTKM